MIFPAKPQKGGAWLSATAGSSTGGGEQSRSHPGGKALADLQGGLRAAAEKHWIKVRSWRPHPAFVVKMRFPSPPPPWQSWDQTCLLSPILCPPPQALLIPTPLLDTILLSWEAWGGEGCLPGRGGGGRRLSEDWFSEARGPSAPSTSWGFPAQAEGTGVRGPRSGGRG